MVVVFWGMTLEELRQAAVEGRPGASEELADRLRRMILGRLSGRVAQDVADDLTQQVLLKVFERLDNFEPAHEQDAFERWVKVVVANDFRAHLVRQQRRHVALDEATIQDNGGGLSSQLRSRRILDSLARAGNRLATPLREAAQNLLSGGRPRDLADKRGISAGAARWRHWRVRQLFRQLMAT